MRLVALTVGAFVFLFPFYYMLIGSLQEEPDTSVGGAFPNPANLTTKNYSDINGSIDLFGSLVNSGIFTAAVVFSTLFFGLLAGYSLAVLHYRGRGVAFAAVLLVQTIPFQLLMIPLYVLLVRDYGLGDTYLGMILPFAISATAVFIFRQFFLQLPVELFEAARIDGAGEFAILRRIAIPLALPVILTVTLVTFIGPWNEFLWPFLVTKDADMQPLAVVARQLHLQPRIPGGQPVRSDPRRGVCAGGTGDRAVRRLPAPLHLERHRLRRQGLTRDRRRRHPVPLDARRHRHVTRSRTSRGKPKGSSTRRPGTRRTAGCTCCPGWSPPATCPGSAWPRSSSTTASRSGSIAVVSCSRPTKGGSAAPTTAGSKTRE